MPYMLRCCACGAHTNKLYAFDTIGRERMKTYYPSCYNPRGLPVEVMSSIATAEKVPCPSCKSTEGWDFEDVTDSP